MNWGNQHFYLFKHLPFKKQSVQFFSKHVVCCCGLRPPSQGVCQVLGLSLSVS